MVAIKPLCGRLFARPSRGPHNGELRGALWKSFQLGARLYQGRHWIPQGSGAWRSADASRDAGCLAGGCPYVFRQALGADFGW